MGASASPPPKRAAHALTHLIGLRQRIAVDVALTRDAVLRVLVVCSVNLNGFFDFLQVIKDALCVLPDPTANLVQGLRKWHHTQHWMRLLVKLQRLYLCHCLMLLSLLTFCIAALANMLLLPPCALTVRPSLAL